VQDDQASVKPLRDEPDDQREDKKKAELTARKVMYRIETMRLVMNSRGRLFESLMVHVVERCGLAARANL
jgi:hypothetical protein